MTSWKDQQWKSYSALLAIAFAIPLILLMFGSLKAGAQADSGAIVGQVSDSTGAVIPNVSIIAINTLTGFETKTVSNAAGHYELLALRPGPYTVSAEATGFKKLVRTGIVVQVQDRLGIDLKLQVGALTETVSVSAGAPLLQTEDLQTGEVVGYQLIQDLPQYNRHALQMISISGDVQGSGVEANGGGASDTRINGGRSSGIDYIVDGISIVSGQAHYVNQGPPLDDIEEFKVVTNGASADMGRSSGGAVTVVTKSGTNDLHGQMFWYYQGQFLDDTSWQNEGLAGSAAKSPFHQDDFGAAIGGPIVLPHLYHGRNKTFFFATYEGIRNGQAGTLNLTQYPTLAERSGDESNLYITTASGPEYPAMYEPCFEASDCSSAPVPIPGGGGTTAIQKFNKLGTDGMHIPSSLISPTSAKILGTMPGGGYYVPLPNHTPIPGTSDSGNYMGAQSSFITSNLWTVRIDQAFGDKSKLFGRFLHNEYNNGQSSWAGPMSPGTGQSTPGQWSLTLGYNYIFSPTLTMNITAGGQYSPTVSGYAPASVNSNALGLDALTTSFLNGALPNIAADFAENAATQFGWLSQNWGTTVNNMTTGQLVGSITKVLNHHTLQFGAETRRYYDDTGAPGVSTWYLMGDQVTQYSEDIGWGSSFSTVNGLGAFLLGLNDSASTTSFSHQFLAQNYYGAYAEDTWKPSNRLTLSLGLRWDMESPATERHDKLYIWDANAPSEFSIASGWTWGGALQAAGLSPDQIASAQMPSWAATGQYATGGIRIANTPEHPSRFATTYHKAQFAPRLGGDYKLNEKTILRAYIGVMYLPTSGDPNGYASVPAVTLSSSATSAWHQNNYGVNPSIASWANPYATVTNYSRTTQAANYQATGGNGAGGVSAWLHMPHEYDIHVGIERQLPHQLVVEADYSSNVSHSLLAIDEASEFPKNLFFPQNAGLYTTNVWSPQWASPTATSGQTQSNGFTGPMQSLAALEYPMPYYGTAEVTGRNIGRSNFQSGNLRIENRMNHGYQVMLNYQFSKLMDNVGGPEAALWGGVGTGDTTSMGVHPVQTVDTVRDVYSISPLDEKHRISATYMYQLPFGKGRTWLSDVSGAGGHILDGIVGGWEIAGTTVYRSGRPIVFNSTNVNINNNIRVEQTFASCLYAGCGGIVPRNFRSAKSVLVGPGASLGGHITPALDSNAIVNAAPFTYGTLPGVWAGLRNPGNVLSGLSLMKELPFFGPEKGSSVQFRAEANNAFNIAGLGNYHSDIGAPGFGTITSVANQERRIQLSLRYKF